MTMMSRRMERMGRIPGRPEACRGATSPVGPVRGAVGFEMNTDHLGKNLAEPSIPLKTELLIGAGRIPMVGEVLPQMHVVLNQFRPVEQLEGSDRCISMDRTNEPRHHW